MNRTSIRSVRSGAAVLALIVATGLTSRDAHAQLVPTDTGPRLGLAVRRAGFAIGAALALELFAPRVWFEFHAGEVPSPSPPPPSPCCYVPPPPPPPCCSAPPPAVVMLAPEPAPQPEPLHLRLSLSGLFQSPSGQGSIAGMAASLQIRTSAHSLLGLELQSLTSDRSETRASRRDELAALLSGRLFAWDAAIAPYVELAGGLGHASIDTQALQVNASQLIGRVGLGLEMRLGPHLVLDAQIAQVHRLRFDDQSRMVAANDPAFIGEHEQSTEIRGGLGYRF